MNATLHDPLLAEPVNLQPPLMLRSDLAKLLRVDQRTIERWDARGLIPGRVHLPGRSVRYRRELVMAWLDAGCPRPSVRRRTKGPASRSAPHRGSIAR